MSQNIDVKGLSLLPGEIVRFPEKKDIKFRIGMELFENQSEFKLLKGIPGGVYVYFVHSYYLKAKHIEDVAATTDYIVPVHAAVEHDNIFATQFIRRRAEMLG